jgi:hypothetical protein
MAPKRNEKAKNKDNTKEKPKKQAKRVKKKDKSKEIADDAAKVEHVASKKLKLCAGKSSKLRNAMTAGSDGSNSKESLVSEDETVDSVETVS